jgi:hypothetical protein
METPDIGAYAEFGDQAGFIRILLDRIETSDDPFMGLEGLLAFNLSETPDPHLDRLLELVDERERAWEADVAQAAVLHELEQRRGCVGQALRLLRVPMPEPLPFARPPRPKYDELRAIVEAARIQKTEEKALLAQLAALLHDLPADIDDGGPPIHELN